MSDFICPDCRATALRIARAALDVLGAEDTTETTGKVAAEELGEAIEVLRHPPGLRVDGKR
jgi:hypothetical protein